MIRASLLALFSTLVICGFCGKDFASLGRHTWRCKNKVEFDQTSKQNKVAAVEIRTQECLPASSYKFVKCCCGKVCKGARGLKMHQRNCKVIDDMEEELQQQMTDALNEQICDDNVQSAENAVPSLNAQEIFPNLKKGIKLPKSPLQWSTANDFLQLTLSNYPVTTQETNKSINTMATVILYNYFSDNYGFVDANNNNEFESKYKSCSAKELKKVPKKLKCKNGDPKEIKFVAKTLRCLLSRNNTDLQHADVNASDNIDHDKLFNNNFWGYVKKFLKKKTQNRFQHLVLPNVQLTLLRHFPQLFQIKHSTFLAGFLPNVQLTLLRHFPQLFQIKHSTFLAGFSPSLIPQQHHLILTLRPIMRLQMSFER